MTTDPQGILLVREGCYAVKAHELGKMLTSGIMLVPIYHVCGEVFNPTALLLDTIVLAATNRLPDGVAMFFMMETPSPTTEE